MEFFVISVIIIFFIGLGVIFKDIMTHGANKA